MKTLRNTLIIVLVASSLGFVNLFAEMKAKKAESARALEIRDPNAEKIRKISNEALRDVMGGLFIQLKTEQSGKVNIVFTVSEDKHVKVLNVFGRNSALVYAVKQVTNKTAIMVPEAIGGKYMVTVVF